MRNKGKTLQRIDEAQTSIRLCIRALKNRTMTPKQILDKLETANERLMQAVVHVNTNDETP